MAAHPIAASWFGFCADIPYRSTSDKNDGIEARTRYKGNLLAWATKAASTTDCDITFLFNMIIVVGHHFGLTIFSILIFNLIVGFEAGEQSRSLFV